jgi:hypothetical protein
VKLHNLSDVVTPRLSALGLGKVPAVVGGKTIKPGESAEFRYMPPDAARLVHLGVLFAGDKLPDSYLAAKDKEAPKPPVAVEAPPEVQVSQLEVAPTDPPQPTRTSRRFRSEE